MLPVIIIFFKRITDHLQMFFIAEKICIAGINKQCFYIVLAYIIRIGFLDIEKIVIRYILLISTVAFFDVCLKLCYGRMEIDQYFRLYQLLVNDLKQPLI